MADGPVAHVIPHDVDDVGTLAVLLAQLVEPLFDFFVLGRPLLAMLCFQDIKLCIMNDLFHQ